MKHIVYYIICLIALYTMLLIAIVLYIDSKPKQNPHKISSVKLTEVSSKLWKT
jgi:hypothetical protein